EDFAQIIGRPFESFYDYFQARVALPAPQDLMAEYETVLFPELRRELRVFPDARNAIDSLIAAGVPQAIASSSHRERLDLMLDVSGLAQSFAVTIAGDEVERGKPHPDIYLLAAEGLGREPRQCLAVEDTSAGVQSARAAGMKVLAVSREVRSADVLAGADWVVEEIDTEQLERLTGLRS
ncbi:MAG: HAD family hydrolase, partial [Acidimicrobiia bacterium]|nr:HAD family hydrolase [Acidimicrobiia bacterium]